MFSHTFASSHRQAHAQTHTHRNMYTQVHVHTCICVDKTKNQQAQRGISLPITNLGAQSTACVHGIQSEYAFKVHSHVHTRSAQRRHTEEGILSGPSSPHTHPSWRERQPKSEGRSQIKSQQKAWKRQMFMQPGTTAYQTTQSRHITRTSYSYSCSNQHTHTHTNIHTNEHSYIHSNMQTHTHTTTNTHTHTQMYACIFTQTDEQTNVLTSVHQDFP